MKKKDEVEVILDGLRPAITLQLEKIRHDAAVKAHSNVVSQLQKAGVNLTGKATAAAPVKRGPGRPRKNPQPEAVAAPVKRKPGRPRKNPLPETVAASADKPKKKAKAKRVLSEDARKKLAANLAKAREAKAAKAKPAKRKTKESSEAAAAPAQA